MDITQKIIEIPAKHFLHLKWNSSHLDLYLLRGDAQIWGRELPLLTQFRIPHRGAVSVFSQEGCSLKYVGQDLSNFKEIIKEDIERFVTDMNTLSNYLKARREQARADSLAGPVVFVLSKSQLSKQILSKSLINFACKSGFRPMYIDLDPNNLIGVKGSIGASFVSKYFPPDFFEEPQKLIFYGGNQLIPQYYKQQCKQLVTISFNKLERISKTSSAGAVVSLPPFFMESKWRDFQLQLMQILKADVLIINDDLQSQQHWRKQSTLKKLYRVKQPSTLESGQLSSSMALVFFTGRVEPIKTVKVVLRFQDVKILRVVEGIDGKPFLKQFSVRQNNIVKAIIAIIRCRPQHDLNSLFRKLTLSPLLTLAQVGSVNDKEERIEMIVAGDDMERSLRTNTWIYGDLTFSS